MQSEKKIQVTIRENYGQKTIYPVGREAQIFARIAGTKTLTAGTIASIKLLNYIVEIIPQTL